MAEATAKPESLASIRRRRALNWLNLAAAVANLCVVWALATAANNPVVIVTIDGKTYRGELTEDAPATQASTQPATLPAMYSRVAPVANVRGDGFRIATTQTAAGSFVADGWEQNIVIENHPLAVTLADFWSLRAHPQNPEPVNTFKGQGVYADKCGPVVISGYYARSNGWQRDQAPQKRDRFRHHLYSNFDVESLTVEDSWLDDAACAGIQSRGKACTIRRCFLTANGIALLLVGPATIEDCTIYGGHTYYFPADGNKPASWAGDVAIQAYYPVTLRNVVIVGKPGQQNEVTAIPGLKTYHLGAVVSGGDYSKTEWAPPTGADGKRLRKLVTATDCVIAGWPGPAFAGDAKHDGSGFTVKDKPVDANAQIDAIRADMEVRRISVADAVARAQEAVRARVK